MSVRRLFPMASVFVVLAAIAGYLYLENSRAERLTRAVARTQNSQDVQETTSSVPVSPTTIAATIASTIAPTTTAAPVITPINALLIGDSVLAELRWFEQGVVSLQGFTYTLDAESCRRIGRDSCGGREDRTPESVVTVLNNMTQTFDVIVLLGGYHASADTIRAEIAAFLEVASSTAAKIVIVNFKESLAYPSPSDGTRSMFADFNETLRAMEAEGALGSATIADWNMFSQGGGSAWFRSDAMHPNIVGTLAMGWFISATLASLYNNPCPATGITPCVVPEIGDPNTDWLAIYGVPYTDMHCYEDGPDRVRVCEQDRIM